jgi:hypothetical protein
MVQILPELGSADEQNVHIYTIKVHFSPEATFFHRIFSFLQIRENGALVQARARFCPFAACKFL